MITKEELLHSASNNIDAVAESDTCACFVCGGVYPACDVDDFIIETDTALCPVCKKPGVLASSTGLPVSDEKFLNEIKNKYF